MADDMGIDTTLRSYVDSETQMARWTIHLKGPAQELGYLDIHPKWPLFCWVAIAVRTPGPPSEPTAR